MTDFPHKKVPNQLKRRKLSLVFLSDDDDDDDDAVIKQPSQSLPLQSLQPHHDDGDDDDDDNSVPSPPRNKSPSPRLKEHKGNHDTPWRHEQHLLGVEPFVVGLSPTYWAHVPLNVSQLHQLQLIHGVACLMRKNDTNYNNNNHESSHNDDNNHESSYNSNPFQQQQYTPIALSKCVVVGMVVAVERRSSGSIIFVLDDGTGLVDCHVWQDSALERDLLPPLLPTTTTTHADNEQDNQIDWNIDTDSCVQIGQMVQVFGRISIVSIQPEQQSSDLQATGTSSISTSSRSNIICELHVSSMDSFLPAPQVTPGSLDFESRHWIQTTKALDQNACTVHAVLEKLGPTITEQIMSKSDLPSADDTIGEWRLFGARCDCTVPYKHALLYCHCQASIEATDAEFRYRDALLMHLLQREEAQPTTRPLVFSYRDIVEHEQLSTIAAASTAAAATTKEQGHPTKNNAHRIVINTFRKLRKDGILYLVDMEEDTYLLLSCKRVLEPYVKKTLKRDLIRSEPFERPTFLARVPRARLDLVKRMIMKNSET